MKLIPVILSGGIGSRLWPYSRSDFPKPFIQLPDGETLFIKTLKRAQLLPEVHEIFVVCNEKYSHLTKQSVNDVFPNCRITCIWEPEARDTSAAIASAAKIIQDQFGDVCLLVLPSDHLISELDPFVQAVKKAHKLAEAGHLVTFGITPSSIETGYGYIEHDNQEVIRFIEKPNFETAKSLIDSGKVVWNSGMFCFRSSVILDEIAKYFNSLATQLETLQYRKSEGDVYLNSDQYKVMPKQSIDYAVMEKSDNLAVVECAMGWDDIGSWSAYAKLLKDIDIDGNVCTGNVVKIDSRNNLILGNDKLIATVGIDNLVVVATEGATLIARKDLVQKVKKLADVDKVKNNEFMKVQRPWGTYQVVCLGNGYKVKRIEVFPGGQLSLQLHHQRDEHWTVVQGEAYVTNGDSVKLVLPNQSVFIPRMTKHRLENRGAHVCVFVEVQYGDYLGEDDIVRLEDKYHRC